MPKPCKVHGCNNFIWGGGFCNRHQSMRTDKKPKPLKKTASLSKKRKATGEYALFLTIWATRPHIDYITGKPIPEPPFKEDGCTPDIDVRCFMHVIPKGHYKKWRLRDKNIVLGNVKTHEMQELGREFLLNNHPEWMKFYLLHDKYKKEYNEQNPLIQKAGQTQENH